MKRLNLMVLMLASAVMLCFTSCLNEATDPNSGEGQLPANVATLSEQVAAMKSSVAAIEALQVELSETAELQGAAAQLESCATAVKEHIASVEAGMSGVNAAIAAMKLQKEIANVTGALKVEVALLENAARIQAVILSAESGVAAWLGKDFKNYFGVSAEQARLSVMLSSAKSQTLTADALMSDVEAGLRVGDATGLNEVVANVAKNSETLSQLNANMSALASEVEQGYTDAIKSSTSKNALKTLNTKATTALANSTPTINDLDARIKACEKALADLNTRLEKVEADINALLGMIQSLTFVSEYSDDKAVAYYSMTNAINQERSEEQKRERVPEETFNLTFLVRPAAVADALAQTWDESLSVIGYYANAIQTRATANIQAFEIVNAISTTGKGLLTVTVNNAFDDEFYFKEKGAKLALAVESGRNNCVSKFVEIVPRDISGKVYAESITLTPETLSIQDGDTYKFSPVVSPANVTDAGFTWQTFGTEFFTVDENGKLTAEKVGTSPVEVTANATDEWGRTLTARCDVTVTPAIEINGPGYVEVGHTINLTLDSPNTIYPDDVKWNIVLDAYGDNASNYVTWTKNESNGGLEIVGLKACYNTTAKEYNKFDVICTIGQANPVVVQKELRVVYAQPNGVSLRNGLPNDAEEVTIKIGQTYDLAADILPAEAQQSGFFRCKYESNAEYYVSCGGLANYGGLVTAVGVGTATMKIRVLNYTTFDYFYPKNGEYVRYLDINVEPYWVTGLSLSAPDEIDIDVPNKITPVFVSDVQGEDPTNQILTWESLTEEVAEVDKDGNITGKKEGTAIIRATTDASATENGVPMEATCTLTVVKPGVEVVVGEYYFSDGTWGSLSDSNAGKTPIGVIFAKVNAAALDSHLGAGHSDCTHGLAIGLKQLPSTTYANGNSSASRNTPGNWLFNNGYYNYDISKVCGYGNTKGILALPDSDNQFGISVCDGLSSYTPVAPGVSSGWYVPSFKEMQMITEEITKVNEAITNVYGTILSGDLYWSSSLRMVWYNNKVQAGYLDYTYCTPFSISKNTWNATNTTTDSNSYPVRVVLAF